MKESQFRRGDKHCGTQYICTLCWKGLNVLNALPDFVSPIYSTDKATSADRINVSQRVSDLFFSYLWSFSSARSTLARSVQFCECKTVAFLCKDRGAIRSMLYIMWQNSFVISKFEILKQHKSFEDCDYTLPVSFHHLTTMGPGNFKHCR